MPTGITFFVFILLILGVSMMVLGVITIIEFILNLEGRSGYSLRDHLEGRWVKFKLSIQRRLPW